jgi:hypothetical protein
MIGPADLSSVGVALLALVDILALFGGLFFLWRAIRRAWRFARQARRRSLTAAFRSSRHVAQRQAMRCAMDVSYYLSRLALLFCTNLVSISGVLFAAVFLVGKDGGGDAGALAACSLLIFTALSVRSVYRTVRLIRQVLKMRRKIRSVEARKRRLALAADQMARRTLEFSRAPRSDFAQG